MGTQTLLNAAKEFGVEKYIQISTDEVYGTLGKTGYFTETTPLQPNSPYSASKAGGDLITRAYGETFDLPINITRCSNNYGPYQFPEKLIPLMISNALEGKKLPVPHCIKGTDGWKLDKDIAAALEAKRYTPVEKDTFGSVKLPEMIKQAAGDDDLTVELIGLCTDICVISNALLLKANFPEAAIAVDENCCAGVTPEKHDAAIETMKSCQIDII